MQPALRNALKADGKSVKTEDIRNDYEGFVEKFKPKKTTDDCYTPPHIYEAVLQWVREQCPQIQDLRVVRPFKPEVLTVSKLQPLSQRVMEFSVKRSGTSVPVRQPTPAQAWYNSATYTLHRLTKASAHFIFSAHNTAP